MVVGAVAEAAAVLGGTTGGRTGITKNEGKPAYNSKINTGGCGWQYPGPSPKLCLRTVVMLHGCMS